MKIIGQYANYDNGQVTVTYTLDNGETHTKPIDEFRKFKQSLNTFNTVPNTAITSGNQLPSTFAPTDRFNLTPYSQSQTPTPNNQFNTNIVSPKPQPKPTKTFADTPRGRAQQSAWERSQRRGSGTRSTIETPESQGVNTVIDTFAPELKGQVSRKGRHAFQFGSTKEVPTGEDASLSEVADAINHNQRQGIATVGRMVLNSGLDLLQETSDTLLWDLPGAVGLGESTTKEKPNRGFLRVFPPLPYLKHENGNNEWENMGTGFIQFGLGMATLGKVASTTAKGALKLTPVGKTALTKYGKLSKVSKGIISGTTQGAVVDFAGFDQYEGRLTDLADGIVKGVHSGDIDFSEWAVVGGGLDSAASGLADSMGGSIANVPLIGWLASSEDDEGLSGRFKNLVEGIGTGLVLDGVVSSARTLKLNSDLYKAVDAFNKKASELDNQLGLSNKNQQFIESFVEGNQTEDLAKSFQLNRERRFSIYNGTAPEMKPFRKDVETKLKKVKDHSLWSNKVEKRLEAVGFEEARVNAEVKSDPVTLRDDQVTVASEDSKNPVITLEPETPIQIEIDESTPTQRIDERKTSLQNLYAKTNNLLAEATQTAKAAERLQRTGATTVKSLRRGIAGLESLKLQAQLSELDELEEIRQLSDIEYTQQQVAKKTIRRGLETLSDNQILGLMELDSATIGELRYDQDRLQGVIDALNENVRNQEAGIALASKTAKAEVNRLTELRNRQLGDLNSLEEIGKDSKAIKRSTNEIEKPNGLREQITKKQNELRILDETIGRELLNFNRKKERGQIKGKAGAKTQEAFNRNAIKLNAKKGILTDQLNGLQKKLDDRLQEIKTLESTRDEKIRTYFDQQPDLQSLDPEPPTPKTKDIQDPVNEIDPVESEAKNQASPGVTQTVDESTGYQPPRAVTLESKKTVMGVPVGEPTTPMSGFSFIGQRRLALPEGGKTSVTTEPRQVVIETPGGSSAGNLIEVRASGDVGQQLVNNSNATIENGQLIIRGVPIDSSPYTKNGQKFWRQFYSFSDQEILAAIDRAPEHLQRRMRGILLLKSANERLAEMFDIIGETKLASEFIDSNAVGYEAMRNLVFDAWKRDRWAKAHSSALGRFLIGRTVGLGGRFVAAESISSIATQGFIDTVSFAPGLVSPIFKASGIPSLEAFGHLLDGLGNAEHWVSHMHLFGLGGTGTDIAGKLAIDAALTRGLHDIGDHVPFIGDVTEEVSRFFDSTVGDWAKNNSVIFSRWMEKRSELRNFDNLIKNLKVERKNITSQRGLLSTEIKKAQETGTNDQVLDLQQQDSVLSESLVAKDEQIAQLENQARELFLELPTFAYWSADMAGRLHGPLVNSVAHGIYLAETAGIRSLRLVAAPIEAAYGAMEIALSGGLDRQIGANIQGDHLLLNAHKLVYDTTTESAEAISRTVEKIIDPSISYDAPTIPTIVGADFQTLTPGELISNKLEGLNNRGTLLWSRLDDQIRGGEQNATKLITTLQKWADSSLELKNEIRNTLGQLITPDGRPLIETQGQLLGPDGKPLGTQPQSQLLGPDGKPLQRSQDVREGLGDKPTESPLSPQYQPFDREQLPVQDPVGGFFKRLEDSIRQGPTTTESPQYQPFNRDTLEVQDPLMDLFPQAGWDRQQKALDALSGLYKQVSRSPKAALTLLSELITRGDQSQISQLSLPVDAYVQAQNLPIVVKNQAEQLLNLSGALPYNMDGVRQLLGRTATKADKKTYVGIIRSLKLAANRQIEWAEAMQTLIGMKGEEDLKIGYGKDESIATSTTTQSSGQQLTWEGALDENIQTKPSNPIDDLAARQAEDLQTSYKWVDVEAFEVPLTSSEQLQNFAQGLSEDVKGRWTRAKNWIKQKTDSVTNQYQKVQSVWENHFDSPQWDRDRNTRELVAKKILGIGEFTESQLSRQDREIETFQRRLLDVFEMAYQSDTAIELERKLSGQPTFIKKLARSAYARSATLGKIASSAGTSLAEYIRIKSDQFIRTRATRQLELGEITREHFTNDPLRLGEGTGIYKGPEYRIDFPDEYQGEIDGPTGLIPTDPQNTSQLGLGIDTEKYVKESAEENANRAENFVSNRATAAIINKGADIVASARKLGKNIRTIGKNVENKLPWQRKQTLAQQTQTLVATKNLVISLEEGDILDASKYSDELVDSFSVTDAKEEGSWLSNALNRVKNKVEEMSKNADQRRADKERKRREAFLQDYYQREKNLSEKRAKELAESHDLRDELIDELGQERVARENYQDLARSEGERRNIAENKIQSLEQKNSLIRQKIDQISTRAFNAERELSSTKIALTQSRNLAQSWENRARSLDIELQKNKSEVSTLKEKYESSQNAYQNAHNKAIELQKAKSELATKASAEARKLRNERDINKAKYDSSQNALELKEAEKVQWEFQAKLEKERADSLETSLTQKTSEAEQTRLESSEWEKLAKDTKLERDAWEEKANLSASEKESLLRRIEVLEQKDVFSTNRISELEANDAKQQKIIKDSIANEKRFKDGISTINEKSKDLKSQVLKISIETESTIKSLKDELKTEIGKKESLQNSLNVINEKSKSLEKSASEAVESNDKLKAELDQTKVEKLELENGLNEINERVIDLEQKIVRTVESSQERINDLNGQLSDNIFRNNELQQQLNNSENIRSIQEANSIADKNEISRLKAERTSDKKQISSLQEKLTKKEELLEQKDQKLIEQNDFIIDLVEFSKDLKTQLDGEIKNRKEIQTKYDASEAEKIELRNKLNEKTDEAFSLNTQKSKLLTELSSAREKAKDYDDLKRNLAEINSKLDLVEEEKVKLKKALESKNTESSKYADDLSNSAELIDSISSVLRSTEDNLLSTQNKLSDTELFLKESNRQKIIWEQRAIKAENLVIDLESEKSSLLSRLDSNDKERNRLQTSENNLKSRETELRNRVNGLELENQKLSGYKVAYQKGIEKLDIIEQQLTKLDVQVREGRDQYRGELSNKRAEKERLVNSLSELQENIKTLEENNKNLKETITNDKRKFDSDLEQVQIKLTEKDNENLDLLNRLNETNNKLDTERQNRIKAESEVSRITTIKDTYVEKFRNLETTYKQTLITLSGDFYTIDTLIKKLSDKDAQLSNQEAIGNDIKDRYESLENKYNSLEDKTTKEAIETKKKFKSVQEEASNWENKYLELFKEHEKLSSQLVETETKADNALEALKLNEAQTNKLSEETGIPLAIRSDDTDLSMSQTLQEQFAGLEKSAHEIKKQGEHTKQRANRAADVAQKDVENSKLDQWEGRLNARAARKIERQYGRPFYLFWLPQTQKAKRARQTRNDWNVLKQNAREEEKRGILFRKRVKTTRSGINRANRKLSKGENVARRFKNRLINSRNRTERLLKSVNKHQDIKDTRDARPDAENKFVRKFQEFRRNRATKLLKKTEDALEKAKTSEKQVIREAKQEMPRVHQEIKDSAEDIVDANERLDKGIDNRKMPDELKIEKERPKPIDLSAEAVNVDVIGLKNDPLALGQAESSIDVSSVKNSVNEINGEQNLLLEGNSTARSLETKQLAPGDDGGKVVETVQNAPEQDSNPVVIVAQSVDESPEIIPERPTAGSVNDFPINEIQVDPDTFQTKGGQVRDIYRPQMANELQVYFDADGELGEPGQTWLINGHHRLEAAKNSNAETVNVHYLPNDVVSNANQAGILGGIQNVFDRGGKVIDAAKALRNPDVTPGMKFHIESTYGTKGENAVKLSRIPNSIFNSDKPTLSQKVALGDRDLSVKILNKVWEIAEERQWTPNRIKNAVWEINENISPGKGAERINEMFGSTDESQMNRRISIRASMERTTKLKNWKIAASSPQVRAVMDEIIPQMSNDLQFSTKLKNEYKTRLEDAAKDYLENDLNIVEDGGTSVTENVLNSVTQIRDVTTKAANTVGNILSGKGKTLDPTPTPKKISEVKEPTDEPEISYKGRNIQRDIRDTKAAIEQIDSKNASRIEREASNYAQLQRELDNSLNKAEASEIRKKMRNVVKKVTGWKFVKDNQHMNTLARERLNLAAKIASEVGGEYGETLFSGLPIPDFGRALKDIRIWGIQSLPLKFQLMFGELFAIRDIVKAWDKKAKDGIESLSKNEQIMTSGIDDAEIPNMRLSEKLVSDLDKIDPNVQSKIDSDILNDELNYASSILRQTRNAIDELVIENLGDDRIIDELRNNPDSPLWEELSLPNRENLEDLFETENSLSSAIGQIENSAGMVMEDLEPSKPIVPDSETISMSRAYVEQLNELPGPGKNRIDEHKTSLEQRLSEVRSQIKMKEIGTEPLNTQKQRLKPRVEEIRQSLENDPNTLPEGALELNKELTALDQEIAYIDSLPSRDSLLDLEEQLIREQYLLNQTEIGIKPDLKISGVPLAALRKLLGWLDELGQIPEARALTEEDAKILSDQAKQDAWESLPKPFRNAINNTLKMVKDTAHRTTKIGQQDVLNEAINEQTNRQNVTADRVEVKPGFNAEDLENEVRNKMPSTLSDLKAQYAELSGDDPVRAYEAWSKIFTDKIDPVMHDDELRKLSYEFLNRDGMNEEIASEALQPMLDSLGRNGTAEFLGARMQLAYSMQKSGRIADKFLNLGADATDELRADTSKLLIEQLSQTLGLQRAYRQTVRGLGRTLRAAGLRFDSGSKFHVSKGLVADAWTDMVKKEADNRPVKMLGHNISVKMDDAISKLEDGLPVNWEDKALQEELSVLSMLAKDMENEPFTGIIADQIEKGAKIGANGLLTARTANILSAWPTFWMNTVNGLFRIATLPAYPIFGSVTNPTELPKAVKRAALTYAQIGKQLSGAMRLGAVSFREGIGLFDPIGTRIEGQASGNLVDDVMEVRPELGWDLNNITSPEFKENFPHWSNGFNLLWKFLTNPLRMLTASDTVLKAVQGNAEHWVRLYEESYDQLARGGETGDIGKMAAERADKLLKASLMDVIIHPDDPRRRKVIPEAAMSNEHALNTGRQVTFTDEMLVEPEGRSMKRGEELAKRRGVDESDIPYETSDYMSQQGGKRISKAVTNATYALWIWPKILSDMKKTPGIGPVISIIAPFLKTPTNIIKSAMRHSPAAILVDSWWRDVTSEDMVTRQRARGEVVLGSMAIATTIYTLNHNNNIEITGAGPQEYNTRRMWREVKGMNPYSFRTRKDENSEWSEWISYRSFEPLASLVATIADYRMMHTMMTEEEKDRAGAEMVLKVIGQGASSALGKTWFAGLQELSDMIQRTSNSDTNIPGKRHPFYRWLQRNVASFAPRSSAVRISKRNEDPTVRTVPSSNFGSEMLGEFSKVMRIPGWNPELPPVIDPLQGNPIVLQGINGAEWMENIWFNGILENVSPHVAFQTPSYPTDPVRQELVKAGINLPTYQGNSAKRRFTKNGRIKDNHMTHEEWTQWLLFRTKKPLEIDGKAYTLYDRLDTIIKSDLYNSLPDYDGVNREINRNYRAEMLTKEIQRFNKNADRYFLASPAADRINANLARFGTLDNIEAFKEQFGHLQEGVNVEKATQEAYEAITGNE